MIFLDSLKQHEDFGRVIEKVTDGSTVMRVHRDVYKLAAKLAEEDKAKLLKAGKLLFAPDYSTWLDIDTGDGQIGFYFQGRGESVTQGDTLLLMQKQGDEHPLLLPSALDIPSGDLSLGFSPASVKRLPFKPASLDVDPILGGRLLSTITPLILAILALVNSPKIVKKTYIDQAKINRKREGRGRYTFHPHHAVKLDIDKEIIKTTGGIGTGASKALHMVRAHLRLVSDRYVLVSPHWRGDPQIGVRRTTYEAERHNSRWQD